MYFYKRGAVWGEAVKKYLRGEGAADAVQEVKEEVMEAQADGEVRQRRKG